LSPRLALHSLVTRFIALGWILLIIGSVASYWRISEFLRQDLEQSISANQLALAGYVAGNVQSRLNDRHRLLDRIAAILPRPLLADPPTLRV